MLPDVMIAKNIILLRMIYAVNPVINRGTSTGRIFGLLDDL